MAEVVANGVTLHVQRLSGDRVRRPVVFVHGLLTDNLSGLYLTLAPAVAAAGADAILYDLRGHGRSERPAGGYALADSVADLDALLDALVGTDPVDLVGYSYGSAVALAMAVRHPRRVASMALIEAHLLLNGWGVAMGRTLSRIVEGSYDGEAPRVRPGSRQAVRLAGVMESLLLRTTLRHDLAATPPLTEAELAAVACPVLTICGERSSQAGAARRLGRLLPDCRVRILPGHGHFLLREGAAEVRAAVLAWLTERIWP